MGSPLHPGLRRHQSDSRAIPRQVLRAPQSQPRAPRRRSQVSARACGPARQPSRSLPAWFRRCWQPTRLVPASLRPVGVQVVAAEGHPGPGGRVEPRSFNSSVSSSKVTANRSQLARHDEVTSSESSRRLIPKCACRFMPAQAPINHVIRLQHGKVIGQAGSRGVRFLVPISPRHFPSVRSSQSARHTRAKRAPSSSPTPPSGPLRVCANDREANSGTGIGHAGVR